MSSSHNEPRKRKWPTVVVMVLIVLTALYLLGTVTSQSSTESTSDSATLTAALEKQAADMQSQLPKKMNETVTANNVTVSGTTIIYDMSLTPDVDESQLNNQSLKDPLVGTLCLNPDSRAMLDAGATFEYDYTHSGSGGVYKVAITKYDC